MTVSIIGGGFCGMMTAVHLMKSPVPLKIVIINSGHPFGRGIAYSPYSRHHLLNVTAGKMSAFPDRPGHFVDWILSHEHFEGLTDPNLIGSSFMPRYLYGDYLQDVWSEALQSKPANVLVEAIDGYAERIIQSRDQYTVSCGSVSLTADAIVLATGNSIPAMPVVKEEGVVDSGLYFNNPWSPQSVEPRVSGKGDVLILGNGLTMVDTVIGLIEKGFTGKIYSISPNGFAILPHRHTGPAYEAMSNDVRNLAGKYDLITIVKLFRKHVRLVRKLGLSAETVVDALRPWTQKIWRALTDAERWEFLDRLRHLWGVARHRLPIHVHDRIQTLRIDDKLKVIAGKVLIMKRESNAVTVEYFNKKTRLKETIRVDRIINCTGPATDVLESDNRLLRDLHKQGIVTKDNLDLGIMIDADSFRVINKSGRKQQGVYAIGNIIKGVLWETTAVPELRVQAHHVAAMILSENKAKVPAGMNV